MGLGFQQDVNSGVLDESCMCDPPFHLLGLCCFVNYGALCIALIVSSDVDVFTLEVHNILWG